MPPKIPFTEQQISEALKTLQLADRSEISKRMFRVTIGTAIIVVMSAMSGAWTVRGIKEQQDQNIVTIQRTIAGLETTVGELKNGDDRWNLKHQAENAKQFQLRNPMITVPDPYEIKMRVGK